MANLYIVLGSTLLLCLLSLVLERSRLALATTAATGRNCTPPSHNTEWSRAKQGRAVLQEKKMKTEEKVCQHGVKYMPSPVLEQNILVTEWSFAAVEI